MNWKLILLGGLAWYVVTFIAGIGTVTVIHDGILRPTYKEHPGFFRPELLQDPQDTASLMPYWIVTGLAASFITAVLYGWVRTAFKRSGWQQGMVFGLFLTVSICAVFLTYSGVFNLPLKIYPWWVLDNLILNCLGGAALGFVADKVAPVQTG